MDTRSGCTSRGLVPHWQSSLFMALNRAIASNSDSPQADGGTLERVLDIAASLFWEKGYAATTTREIAAAAGIQQASLYYHVASKEELLYQLCVSSLEQLLLDVESAVNGISDPLERIRAFIRAHLATLLKYQIRHVTMLTELRALSEDHRVDVLALRKKYARLVHSLVEGAQAQGLARPDIPGKYLYLALLNVLNWAVLWFRRDRGLTAGELAALFTPIYLEGAIAPSHRGGWVVPNLRRSRKNSISGAPRPPQAPDKPTSERLLDTAAALFSAKGYAATSTREIAAVLGIQKASLYYHIKTKEDLLYAICKSSLEQIRSDVGAAAGKFRDPLQRTAALIRAHVESMLRDQARHSAALGEMHLLSAERLGQVIRLRDAYEDLVRSVLQEAQTAGALRQDIPVKYLCLSLLGLMNRVEVWYRSGGALSPAQLGKLFTVIFLTGAAATPD